MIEIGIGSRLNLPIYAGRVEKVIGLDQSPKLIAMACKASCRAVFPAEFIEGWSRHLRWKMGASILS